MNQTRRHLLLTPLAWPGLASAQSGLGAAAGNEAIAPAPPALGSRLTVPALERLDGSRFEPRDAEGRVLLLYWWASWCPFCAETTPHVEALWRAERARGLLVLALSIDNQPQPARDYLARRGTPALPADLGAHDALVYSTVQGDARWLLVGPDGQMNPVTVRGPLRSNNLSALLSAARGGLGVAALPRYVAHASLQSGGVVALLADWSLPVQEIHAVYPSPRLVPAKVSGFVGWLQDQFADAWWADLT